MEPKVRAIVAYITIIGWVVAIATNNPKDELASFHIRQSLGVYLFAFVCGVVSWIPVIGWLVAFFGMIAAFVLWLLGFISALQGEKKLLPLVGEQFQEWFATL